MRRLAAISAVIVLCIVFPGCKFTGGGWIPSAERQDKKAIFGFNVTDCGSDEEMQSHFTFHDRYSTVGCAENKGGGLKLVGNATSFDDCTFQDDCDICDIGQTQIVIDYTSTNPNCPGMGEAVICLEDNGEPAFNDFYGIEILDGPYGGYINEGAPQGNIQDLECPDDNGRGGER